MATFKEYFEQKMVEQKIEQSNLLESTEIKNFRDLSNFINSSTMEGHLDKAYLSAVKARATDKNENYMEVFLEFQKKFVKVIEANLKDKEVVFTKLRGQKVKGMPLSLGIMEILGLFKSNFGLEEKEVEKL